MEIKLKANAKINLTLDLTGVLPNNYHSLFTCMQSVSLYDTVFVTTGKEGLTLTSTEKYIPTDERNTAFKAAKLFYKKMNIAPECEIHIRKKIPTGAGLAGGSADAAAVLKALTIAYPDKLSFRNIMDIALSVGADVPFCYVGGTRLCQNIGEVMSALPPFKSDVLIVKPLERVSTKEAYAQFDSGINISHPDNLSFLYYASKGEYKEAQKFSHNMFEDFITVKSGKIIKETMNSHGAWFSSMSGSGSAFYGLFDDSESMKKCAEVLSKDFDFVFLCRTVSKGID